MSAVADAGGRAVEFCDVSFTYRGGVRALDSLSLTWPGTGVVALLGSNGAGKTTLLSLMVGLLRLQSGSITGTEGRIGFVAQDASWPGRFTVGELLEYAAWWQRVPRSARAGRVRAAAGMLQLEEMLDRRLGTLSGGQRRRAMIAQALVHDPAVVVLDEPSAGLDPRQRARLREQTAALAEGRLVIVATHLVDDVQKIARWVTVLDEGTVAFTGSMADVRARYPGVPASLEALYLETTS